MQHPVHDFARQKGNLWCTRKSGRGTLFFKLWKDYRSSCGSNREKTRVSFYAQYKNVFLCCCWMQFSLPMVSELGNLSESKTGQACGRGGNLARRTRGQGDSINMPFHILHLFRTNDFSGICAGYNETGQ